MLWALMLTAGLMGLAGSPHCLAMCGAACAGAARGVGTGRTRTALFWLLTGRALGYAAGGALAAVSVQALGHWGASSAMLAPVWSLAQAGALVLGVWLVWQGRQPLWFAKLGRRRGAAATVPEGWRPVAGPRRAAALGAAWVMLPCGLLYSALVVAALAGGPAQGAAVMLAFALTSGLALGLGPLLWLRFVGSRGAAAGVAAEAWVVRLAGVLLASSALWALSHGWREMIPGLCLPAA